MFLISLIISFVISPSYLMIIMFFSLFFYPIYILLYFGLKKQIKWAVENKKFNKVMAITFLIATSISTVVIIIGNIVDESNIIYFTLSSFLSLTLYVMYFIFSFYLIYFPIKLFLK